MEQKKHEKFMSDQVREIVKYKEEKEKEAGKDLGDQPIYEWIMFQSKRFREVWEMSEDIKQFLHDLSQPVGVTHGFVTMLISELEENEYYGNDHIEKMAKCIKISCEKMLTTFCSRRDKISSTLEDDEDDDVIDKKKEG